MRMSVKAVSSARKGVSVFEAGPYRSRVVGATARRAIIWGSRHLIEARVFGVGSETDSLVFVEGSSLWTPKSVQGEYSRSVPYGGTPVKSSAVVLVAVEAFLVARVTLSSGWRQTAG